MRDIAEIVSRREALEEDDYDDNDYDGNGNDDDSAATAAARTTARTPSAKEVRLAKYKKLAKKVLSKSLVLAVNYVQGRIAMEASRRVAEARDRAVPKFPLF